MSENNSEEQYSNTRCPDDAESPRKRMRLDNSSRKSWSLMDRKTDSEVLQEMGVSPLDSDEADHQMDTHHPRTLKRKHTRDLENVNPNVLASSPRPSPRKHSPRDKAKPLTETNVDTTLVKDEETPLGQSVSGTYSYMLTCERTDSHRSHSPVPVACPAPARSVAGSECDSQPDAFSRLSDEVMLSVLRWLPKRTLAHCMTLSKRWYRMACDETLWQRLDLGNKTLNKGALGRILQRKCSVLRLASSEIAWWRPAPPPPPSRIQYLDLSMSAVDVATLNHLLRACPLLKKLSLENVTIDDDTCHAIGECVHLETLNVSMSRGLSPGGLTRVLSNCPLQALNVSWCALSEHCLEVLSSLVPARIQRLNVAGARLLTDDMARAVCARCARLRELDLSDCSRVTWGGVSAARGCSLLEHLALSRCYLLPVAHLAKLSALPALQFLEVWGMLQETSLAALRAALPGVSVNLYMFSAIARPTVGTRRTSIWGLRTRDHS